MSIFSNIAGALSSTFTIGIPGQQVDLGTSVDENGVRLVTGGILLESGKGLSLQSTTGGREIVLEPAASASGDKMVLRLPGAPGSSGQILKVNTVEDGVMSLIWSTESGGTDGASAYELAVANGFVGDLEAWLDSLVGPEGPQGDKGDTGDTGPEGPKGETGEAGADGADADLNDADLTGDTTIESVTLLDVVETVYSISDGAGFEINPANGGIQTVTLSANRTPQATDFSNGQSVTLMVDDGSARTLTWTHGTLSPVWDVPGGVPPTLKTTGYTTIVLWKVSNQIYGRY